VLGNLRFPDSVERRRTHGKYWDERRGKGKKNAGTGDVYDGSAREVRAPDDMGKTSSDTLDERGERGEKGRGEESIRHLSNDTYAEFQGGSSEMVRGKRRKTRTSKNSSLSKDASTVAGLKCCENNATSFTIAQAKEEEFKISARLFLSLLSQFPYPIKRPREEKEGHHTEAAGRMTLMLARPEDE